jgi:hypothetical protein
MRTVNQIIQRLLGVVGLASGSSESVRICFVDGLPCIHPDWADCQYKYAGDEPEYAELWVAGKEESEGYCSKLPEGISRTEMLTCLGAFGERARNEALKRVKKGCYRGKKRCV